MLNAAALRLDAYLRRQNIYLQTEQYPGLLQALDESLHSADVPALKRSAHTLRQALRNQGAECRQSQAFEAVAAYLGYRDWNTSRCVAEAGELQLPGGQNTGWSIKSADVDVLPALKDGDSFCKRVTSDPGAV